jgi:hypothetical protein
MRPPDTETALISLPTTTLGRAVAIGAFLAVVACSPGAGSTHSTLTPSPSEVPSSIAASSSDAAAPRDTAPPSVATESPHASASRVPTPPSTPAAQVPAKPTGVTFTTDSVELPKPTGTAEVTYQVTHTVRWEAPRTDGVEIRVYGVTECLSAPSDPPPGTAGPCLVEHTLLPSSVMKLAAKVQAGAGEFSWIAPFYHDCAGPPVGPDGLDYAATVIAAYNDAGHSVFAIADPGQWWRAGPNDTIC